MKMSLSSITIYSVQENSLISQQHNHYVAKKQFVLRSHHVGIAKKLHATALRSKLNV